MDGLFFVFLGGLILVFPVIAVVALVRTAGFRRKLEESLLEYQDKISDLRGEVASLRRDLNELAKAGKRPEFAAQAAKVSEPNPSPVLVPETPRPAPAHVEPAAETAVRPSPAQAEAGVPPVGVAAFTAPPPPRSVPPPAVPPAVPAPVPRPVVATDVPVSAAVPEPKMPPAPVAPPARPEPSLRFAAFEAAPPRKPVSERLKGVLPFEEVLGMNLFAKIGIILLVLGFAFLGQFAFAAMGPAARVGLIYGVAGAMLGAGIRFESRDRYRLVARAGIGGGWAMLFFTTYAMHHVAAMAVLASNTVDCILMLGVAAAMVTHTLRYRSQVVTGLAFLLAFSTVALSQDSVYALAAGVILALGIAAIALRMSWFELEIFGIAASYANHFYWLYKLYPDGFAGKPFPEFWASVVILVLYWAIFRVSYVARSIRSPRDEKTSTIAALLNTVLLLADMKFQSTHPELAFYALLGLGLVEFAFGQLPLLRRRRRPAFVFLSVIGAILVFAAVPFKFSGNNIALFWMIAAEALLIAGIVQAEVLFRRLGLLAGVVTGLLVGYEARGIIDLRQHSDSPLIQDGVLLLTCSALFYFNAQVLRRKWAQLFADFDGRLATAQSYIGCLTAFLGVWAIFTGDWTAIGWAVLMVAAAYGVRCLNDRHLLVEGSLLGAAVAIQALAVNCHWDLVYPHHIALRFITLPLLGAAFYAMGWALSGVEDMRLVPRTLALWAGSIALVLLAWLDISQPWVAPSWMAFAVLLVLVARRIRLGAFAYQEHVLALAVAIQLFSVNLDATRTIERYLPITLCAVAFYAVSRFSTLKEAPYRRPAAWAHTWVATALLAALAWHESPEPWLASIWAVFALALALTDRIFDVEELPWQAHLLSLLAVVRAVSVNVFNEEKWRGIDIRLITVTIVVAALYAIARWVRMPESLRKTEASHIYTWTASALTAWMLWSELQSIGVALGLAVFGLVLFEWGDWRGIRQLRLQAYVLLTAAFARIFFVNLTAVAVAGEWLSPRIYSVAPIALIDFYVWTRLQSAKAKPEIRGWVVRDLIAYFGTGCIAALLYSQVTPEWVAVTWAAMVLVLIGAALALRKEVFLEQAVLLTVGTVTRALAHNIFGGSYFVPGGWRGSFLIVAVAASLLLAALPLAFRLRLRYAERRPESRIGRLLAIDRAEQWLFFAPLLLLAIVIAVKMQPGMITLSWGIEGLLAIVFGLAASQRSYRITGLLLLLLCVGKIVALDAWHLDQRDRYITFIALGAALTLVSTLYGRFRETVRRLL